MWTFLKRHSRHVLWASTVLNTFLYRWRGIDLCFALISLSLQLLCIKLVPVSWFAKRRLTLSFRVTVGLLVFILTTSMSSNEFVYFEEFYMVTQQFVEIMHEIQQQHQANQQQQVNQQQQGQNVAQAPAGAG